MQNSKQSQVQRFLTDSQAVVCLCNVFNLYRDVFRTMTACDVRCMKKEIDFVPFFFLHVSVRFVLFILSNNRSSRFVLFFCVLFCFLFFFCFFFVPCCTLRFPLKNNVRFVFTPICYVRVHVLHVYVIRIYLRILVSKTIFIPDDIVV